MFKTFFKNCLKVHYVLLYCNWCV